MVGQEENGLKIVADRWGAAFDEQCELFYRAWTLFLLLTCFSFCHCVGYLEYDVGFRDGDVRLAGVHAGFKDGWLCVTVPRHGSASVPRL